MRTISLIMMVMALCIAGCSGKTSSELFAEGMAALRQGNGSGAIVMFRNALEKEPNRVEIRRELARAYVATGKYELAEREFLKVQRQKPSQTELLLELAKLYNLMRKPELAARHAEDYLKTVPGSADALEVLGVACAARNLPEEAESYFLSCLEKEGNRTGTKTELAGLYMKTGNRDKAARLLEEVTAADPTLTKPYYMLAELEMAKGRKDKALEHYGKIIAISRNEPDAYYKSAVISMENNGDPAQAASIAEDLIKRFPRRGEGYRLKGMVAFRRQNLPEAIGALQTSLKMQPSVLGHFYLGLCLYQQGELENALSQFRQILDRVPSANQARVLAGLILLKQERFDDAIAEVSRVIKDDERNALAHNVLGNAYLAKGMYDEGMRELNRCTVIDPHIIDAHLKKGVFHLSQGELDSVAADLTAAVKVAPEFLNTRLMLSSFHLRRNNPEKALATLEEGLTGGKTDARLYTNMAWVMFRMKKSERGVQYLRKAIASDPAAPEAYYLLASHYRKVGEPGKALEQYRQILSHKPQDATALLAMAALFESVNKTAEAEEYYQKARNTGSPAAYEVLARRAKKEKDYRKALAVVEEGLKKAPRSLPLLEMKAALQMEGELHLDAMRTLDDIEAIDPELGIRLKVNSQLQQKKYAEALANARRAVALQPGSANGHLLAASVYKSRHEPEKAIEELKNGLKASGGNTVVELALAELYAQAGNHAQALKSCEKLLRAQPGNVAAHFAMGVYLEATGNKKEAAKRYRRALSLDGSHIPSLNNLAYLCADGHGSRSDAVRLAETALSLDPGNSGVMDTFGYALFKNGRIGDARRTLERALSLAPEHPTINYHLALVYQEQGEKALAAARLKKSLQAGNFAEAQLARLLLAELN